jgi:putative serine protease PepD
VLAIAAGAAGSAVTLAVRADQVTAVQVAAPVTGSSAAGEPLAKVAATVMPSVVTITESTPGASGIGSGVILSEDGTILTNDHVIAAAAGGSGTLTVTFDNGRTAGASVVGRNAAKDIAVIRVAVTGLTPAVLGTNAVLHPGDTVMAIGSPLGLDASVSVGVVSALNRTISVGGSATLPGQEPSESITGAIQTDASINPGNSGGPLFDVNGRVIGISTAIATTGGGYIGQQSGSIGVGFAIPITTAWTTAQQLIAK